jgi:NitT/TauT family transport system substrate-binding protein
MSGRVISLASAGVLTLALVACGSSDESGADGSSDPSAPVELTMAVVPAATFAPVFVGLEEGIFEKHGIDLTIDVGGLAPTVFPRILSGEVDLGANTWGTLVTARAQGLPLVGIAPVDRGGESPEDDYQGVMVASDGPSDLAGLEGATIGVPSLKSFTDSQVRSVLQEQGVDVSTIEFLALGFPDMPGALASGQVDAVGVVEPFQTVIEGQGGTSLTSLSRSQLMGSIVASEQMVADRPDDVLRFQEAWAEVLEFAIANPDAVRTALVEGLGLEADLAEAITLPIWTPEVTEDEVQEISDMMADVDAVDEPVPAAELMTAFPLED